MNDLGQPAPPPADPLGQGPPRAAPFGFKGLRSALFGLVLKNLFFTVVTLGIYRFWAKTRVRRFYWSNVRLGGEPFEYLGTGKELLIGFLIALSVLVPLGLLFQLISVLLDAAAPVWLAVANAVFLAGLFVLAQYATYRARRYRLSRTSWRGVRFWLEGSAWAFTRRAMAWAVAVGATLGVAYPWARMALAGYWMNNACFGSGRFRFEGAGRDLIRPWLAVWAVGAFPLLLFGLLNADAYIEGFERMVRENLDEVEVNPSYGFLLLSIAVLPFLFVWYRVREFRYVIARLGFRECGFASDLRVSGVLLLFAGYTVALIAALALVVFFVFTAFGILTNQFGSVAVFVTAILASLAFLGVLGILQEVVLNFGLVRQACTTLTVSDVASFETVAQAADRGPGHGEGLADALNADIGAF